jgi:uncharacterized protein (DUF4415 family)
MNEKTLNNQSETNWARLKSKTDEEINTSEIQPLGERFFANAKVRMPKNKVSVLVNVDKDISEWYEAQGEDSKDLMTTALRIYAETHREIHN